MDFGIDAEGGVDLLDEAEESAVEFAVEPAVTEKSEAETVAADDLKSTSAAPSLQQPRFFKRGGGNAKVAEECSDDGGGGVSDDELLALAKRPCVGPLATKVQRGESSGTEWWSDMFWNTFESARMKLPPRPVRKVRLELPWAGTGAELLAFEVTLRINSTNYMYQ